MAINGELVIGLDPLSHVCVETYQNVPSGRAYGGYRQDLLQNALTPLEKLSVVCSSCDGVMRDPQLTATGYKCASCSDGAEGKAAVRNKAEIEKLKVRCPFRSKSCSWVNPIWLLSSHIERCKLCPVPCPLGCGETPPRRELARHKEEMCSERKISCTFCHVVIKASQCSDHFDLCPSFRLECTNGCDELVLRRNLELHISKFCPLSMVPCSFKKYGCDVVRKRKELDIHETEFVVKHVKLMNTCLEEISTTVIPNSGLRWEINGIKQKFEDNNKLYSDPFYVNNYKFKAEVQFSDTESDRLDLGVFIYLCVGVHDHSLNWPFVGKVLIHLEDRENERSFRTCSFSTDEDDCFSSFTKRTNNKDGFGFYSIATKDEIFTKFSKDDTVTIKIEILHLDGLKAFQRFAT